MQATTAGHLSNNGGVRGHSAGDFFPFRVMSQGTTDNLRHWVLDTKGVKVMSFSHASAACAFARSCHTEWLNG